MRSVVRLVFALIFIVSLISCDIWRVATTVKRPLKPWTPDQIHRYAEKFPEGKLVVASPAISEYSIAMASSALIYNGDGYLFQEPPPASCPDENYYPWLFQALSEGRYDEGDFKSFMSKRLRIWQSKDESRDTMIHYDTKLTKLNTLLDTAYGPVIDPSPAGKLQVVIPFYLSGQRRISTVLVKEAYQAAIEANSGNTFDIWLLYIGGVKSTIDISE